MKKEYKPMIIKVRLLDARDMLTASFELDENEGGMVTPPWFFN